MGGGVVSLRRFSACDMAVTQEFICIAAEYTPKHLKRERTPNPEEPLNPKEALVLENPKL